MIGRIVPGLLLMFLVVVAEQAWGSATKVHRHGLTICSVIIEEMSEGKVNLDKAGEISLAIAEAGNRHFGRVTCGDMWLYMAIAYVESGFRNNIINPQSCLGMFQVHGPSWARKFGLRYRDLLNPSTNADAGIRVFKYYLERYKHLIPALSAYNSDHPTAATGYAWAVLGARKRIKQRYTELYRVFNDRGPGETVPAFPAAFPRPSAATSSASDPGV